MVRQSSLFPMRTSAHFFPAEALSQCHTATALNASVFCGISGHRARGGQDGNHPLIALNQIF
jgi:hypothetical protein